MTLRRKLTLNFHHSQTHGPVKVKVLGSEQPKVLVAAGCNPGLIVMYCLVHGAAPDDHLSALWSLSSDGDLSWLQKLNGGNAGRCEQGHPGPLASTHHSVMAWVINCWPSCILTALVLSWACLLTQLTTRDGVNVASHTLHKLSPPSNHLP